MNPDDRTPTACSPQVLAAALAPQPRLLLDIDEVAAVLSVGRRTAYGLRARPDFPPAVSLGPRCVRYRWSDVATFVERLAAEAAPRSEPAGPARARAEKLRQRGKSGGAIGGTATPPAGKPHATTALADAPSVELRNSNSRRSTAGTHYKATHRGPAS